MIDMPLPTPNKNEAESDFVDRCMNNQVMLGDFPDRGQRAAICYKQYRGDKAQASEVLGKVHYCVKAHVSEQNGNKYTTIEIIDESTSRPCEQPPDTRVRINPAGKDRALKDLLGKPLIGPPTAGHQASETVGHVVDFNSNHATRALFEITDSKAWDEIDSGRWGPVSPQMTPYVAHYDDDGAYVLDEWGWDHFAFVPAGAFPNDGVKSTCIGDPRLCGFTAQKPCGFYHAVAASLSSKSWLKAVKPRTTTDVGAYSPEKAGKAPEEKPDEKTKEVSCMDKCEHEKVIAELTDKNTTLEAEAKDSKAKLAEATKANEKITAELKELKEKPAPTSAPVAASDAMVAVQAELKELKAKNKVLEDWKVAAEETAHMTRVQAVIDARVKAGVLEAKNVQAAIESLKKLPNDALDAMKTDLDAVQGKFDSLPSGPKARLIPGAVAARFDPMQPTVGDRVGKKPGEI